MCHFITATLPSSARLQSASSIFTLYRLGFQIIDNSYISSQIAPKDWYISTTIGHCDCGTSLGKIINYERQLKKFRKQGWSKTKIARWLLQKEKTQEKYRQDLERWTGFITDLLVSGYTHKLGLLLHWYRTDVKNEHIEISGREKINLKDLDTVYLTKIKEDILYEFFV